MPQCKDTQRSWYPEGFEFITNFSRCVCVVGGIIVKNIIFLHWTYRNVAAFYIFWSRSLWLCASHLALLFLAFCRAQNYICEGIFFSPLVDVTSAVVPSVQTVRLRQIVQCITRIDYYGNELSAYFILCVFSFCSVVPHFSIEKDGRLMSILIRMLLMLIKLSVTEIARNMSISICTSNQSIPHKQ